MRWRLRGLIETIAQIAARLMGRDIKDDGCDGEADPNPELTVHVPSTGIGRTECLEPCSVCEG